MMATRFRRTEQLRLSPSTRCGSTDKGRAASIEPRADNDGRLSISSETLDSAIQAATMWYSESSSRHALGVTRHFD
jgi:hypothetical protein